jgi:hypothetical protein
VKMLSREIGSSFFAGLRHPDEQALIEAYFASIQQDVPANEEVTTHLERCTACSRRYAELAVIFTDARTAVDEEIDELSSPEVLERQYTHILKRLAAGQGPGRVLRFPRRGPTVVRRRDVARKWTAAAAAAGLLVGLLAGRWTRLDPRAETVGHVTLRPQFVPRPTIVDDAPPEGLFPGAAQSRAMLFNDEAFLDELDAAIQGPRVAPLMVLDDLTPAIHEVALRFP